MPANPIDLANLADEDLTIEHGPERTCIVTREKHAPDAMIRFVLSPDGLVVPDIRCKLPGRGVWVTAKADQVAMAVKRGSFARGFKTKVALPDDLAGMLDRLLEADALQSLSFANKAAAIVTGFVKVSAALASENLLALLHAQDASPEGLRKLTQALRRHSETRRPLLEINIFTSEQMDLALGRTNVIHAAVKDTAAGAAFLVRAHRLARFRTKTAAKPSVEAEIQADFRAE